MGVITPSNTDNESNMEDFGGKLRASKAGWNTFGNLYA